MMKLSTIFPVRQTIETFRFWLLTYQFPHVFTHQFDRATCHAQIDRNANGCWTLNEIVNTHTGTHMLTDRDTDTCKYTLNCDALCSKEINTKSNRIEHRQNKQIYSIA